METITPLIQNYIVDFASNNNFFFVKGVQGDGYGVRYARLSLSNNGQPYIIDPNAVRAVIMGTKPDNKEICNECEIVDSSTIQFELTQQMLAVSGKSDYSIIIMSTSTNQMLTSFPFYIFSNKTTFDASYVTSSNEFTLLISKINQVDALDKELHSTIDLAELTIKDCENKTVLCVEATNNANTATEELRALEESIVDAENLRVQAESQRESTFDKSVREVTQATNNAITATNDLRTLEESVEKTEALRVEAENLRQSNTSIAIQNAEKATSDAVTAKENAEIATDNTNKATEEAQKRIDEYDSLTVSTVVQNALEATENANTSASNADIARQNAEKATEDANEATELALDAVKQIQDALGIDDTQESSTTVWSSAHTHEVINNTIEEAKEKYQRYKISDVIIKVTDWVNKVIYIKNDKITENSVIDIYYNNSSLLSVYDLDIIYTQGIGYLCLTTSYIPTTDIVIDAIAIENYFNESSVEVSGTV